MNSLDNKTYFLNFLTLCEQHNSAELDSWIQQNDPNLSFAMPLRT